MKKIFIILTTAMLALAAGLTIASAADLSTPPKTIAEVMPAAVPDQWTSCYAEAGVAGYLDSRTTKDLHGTGGIGCDFHVVNSPIVLGAFARFGYTVESHTSKSVVLDLDEAMTFALRAGYLIQPTLLAYAVGCLKVDRHGSNDLCFGAGVEKTIYKTLSLSVEYQADVLNGKTDNHTAIIALKHRF